MARVVLQQRHLRDDHDMHDSNFNSDVERITFAWYQLIILFVFPVVVMCFCYSFVIAVLWVSTKEHARLTQTTEPTTVTAAAAAADG